MSNSDLAVVILAAGKGTRMKSNLHKVLHPLGGRPMLHHLMDTLEYLSPSRKVIVVGAGKEQVEQSVGDQAEIVVQEPQFGTGHAVQVTRDQLSDFSGDVLILYGDVPMLSAATLQNMLDVRHGAGNPAVVVLGFEPADSKAYGRLVVDDQGDLLAIVEHKDASADQRKIGLCNSGIMALDGAVMFDLLDGLDDNNAAGEFYLTDVVAIARAKGLGCAVSVASESEVMGINSRSELAEAEAVFQGTQRQKFMAEGVTLLDPSSVYFSHDTVIGTDVTIEPNVFFGPGVVVEADVTIKGFCHFEGAIIRKGATVGPYARLRPLADVGAGAKIGNFVEVKKSTIEQGAKVSHLSYIGDAIVGTGANIGAGTITCNYDGFNKALTEIGAGAFIGSNTALVAPVKIGAGAIVGAGSVVTREVSTDALVVTRAKQKEMAGWAAAFRQKQIKNKG
ncbi:N-acetylglucosamine-1-phosphate uridyltransferase / Glucosamine-1-phosphate N-acetyltransferase [hydrothermal vent metagenome]|uniref:N-acetylglucosamine-1-phosphate uridyltransferase / Glucosamine-1-phosphate N-acetyltransferase n=1 Tax=hydrothermal vent metagenome TaxID=652676 RepID=A0A3B0R9C1_9ZZZZ